MFNKSLREAVEKNQNHEELSDKRNTEKTELQEKLFQESKDNYATWLHDPITQQVLLKFKQEITKNNVKLLQHCLGTGIDRPVEDRRVLYYSLKNKVIEELLRILVFKNAE